MYQDEEINVKMQNLGSFMGPPKSGGRSQYVVRASGCQALTYITFAVLTFLMEQPVPGVFGEQLLGSLTSPKISP